MCSKDEIIAVIFEDDSDHKAYYHRIRSDMLSTFSEWKNPQNISTLAQIVLIKRTGGGDNQTAIENFKQKYGELLQVDYVGEDVSSTEARTFAKLDLPLQGLVCSEVESFIKSKQIYKKDRLYDYITQILPPKRRKHTAGVIVLAKRFAKRLTRKRLRLLRYCTTMQSI